ncbi:MAG: hypothetical protein LBS12_06485 [Prevotellaceae bacterium]|jgi:hypothetical protein|nr:hypothetical protein [Prevotellaceae bacterium]
MPDFIPRRNYDFNEWQENLVDNAVAKATQWLIPADAVTVVVARRERWRTAFQISEDPSTRTSTAVKNKQIMRKTYTAALRFFVRSYLANNPVVTNVDRLNLGLRVRKTGRPTPVGHIESSPIFKIDFSRVQMHTLIVKDNTMTGIARPAGAAGFEVWRKIGGTAPVDDNEWLMVAQATRSPYTLRYAMSEKGQRVYYRLRWVNTRGAVSAWSDMVSALVG